MTRIEIDLNVRVRGNQTYSGWEDVLEGDLVLHEVVEVVESESGALGRAEVVEIDAERELVYLAVDWSSVAIPAVDREVADAQVGSGSWTDLSKVRVRAFGITPHLLGEAYFRSSSVHLSTGIQKVAPPAAVLVA